MWSAGGLRGSVKAAKGAERMGTRWKRGSEHVRVRKCGGGDGVGGGWRGRTGTEDAHGGGSWRKEGVRRLWAGGGEFTGVGIQMWEDLLG